jgi:zinc resistance-associated protein
MDKGSFDYDPQRAYFHGMRFFAWRMPMSSRPVLAFGLVAMLGSAGFLAATAAAQQSPRPDDQAQVQRSPMDRDGGPRGMHRRFRLSQQDRAAFLDARIAAVKAGLQLTAEQQQMWPALEQAVRDGLAKRREMREKRATQGRPSDPIAAMRLRAELATTRGEALKKIVDAAQPLYASLSDDQKHRLPLLMHGPRARMWDHQGPRSRMGRDRGDNRGGFADRQGPGGRGDRDDRAAPRGRGPSGPGSDDHGPDHDQDHGGDRL